MNKITYKCKSCGWETHIIEDWGDIKPDFCGNKKCDYSAAKASKTKKSFRTEPEMLETIKPKKPEIKHTEHQPVSKAAPKVESNFHEKAEERKKKRRSNSKTPETSEGIDGVGEE